MPNPSTKSRVQRSQEDPIATHNAPALVQDGEANQLDSPTTRMDSALQKVAVQSVQSQRLMQLKAIANGGVVAQRQSVAQNGLPANLKSGVESLSGIAMDDVQVHYNSSKPAQVQAHAYAQGTEIHIAPGQERHLAHEAWHVVQQKQGRVKPTLQLKGVAINDDSGLEKEADEMGAKAIGNVVAQRQPHHQGSALPIMQRKVVVEGKPMDDSAVFDQLKKERLKDSGLRAVLQNFVLPTLSRQERKFESVPQLLDVVGKLVLAVFNSQNVKGMKTLSQYVAAQENLQAQIKADERKEDYFELFTTFGFEHEFADMTKQSPLTGVSHIELAETEKKMAFTGLPFVLETDADNALELVSPPFLIPTVKGVPLPDPTTIELVDALMRTRLLQLSNDQRSGWDRFFNNNPDQKYVLLSKLIAALSEEVGWPFQFKDKLVIKPMHISHNTKMDLLATALNPAAEDQPESKDEVADPMTLNQDQLSKIKVGRSIKSGRQDPKLPVTSQGNFATDVQTTRLVTTPPLMAAGKWFENLEQQLEPIFNKASNPRIGLFYDQLIRKLASLFAVYSQEKVAAGQQWLFEQLKLAQKNEATSQFNAGQRRLFQMHAYICSFVKDASSVWVKDHVVSIAKGILLPEDLAEVREKLKAGSDAVKGLEMLDALSGDFLGFAGFRHDEPQKHWADYVGRVTLAVNGIAAYLSEDHKDEAPAPDVDLYEHDDQFVGARQDTYLDPSKVQQKGLWDRHLQVVEIRRGRPADFLKQANKNL